MENSDFFTRKGQGPKTSLKDLTVVIKPEANFVSLVEEGGQIQQNWVWNSIQEYKVTTCERSERSWDKESSDESPLSSYPCFLLCICEKVTSAGYATQ